MYTLNFAGTAGPEPDITKARVYVAGGAAIEVNVTPGQPFAAQATHPTSGTVLVEHSFVDAAGNEGARRPQQVFIPDQNAPAAPAGDLVLTSVVWS